MREDDDRHGRYEPKDLGELLEIIAWGFALLFERFDRMDARLSTEVGNMATVQDLQDLGTQVTDALSALTAAESAEAPGLGSGQVAIDQTVVDTLHGQLSAVKAQIDSLTSADTPAPATGGPVLAPGDVGAPTPTPAEGDVSTAGLSPADPGTPAASTDPNAPPPAPTSDPSATGTTDPGF